MRTGISFCVSPADRDRLRDLVKDRNAPQKHVWRAQIVLLSAEGAGTNAIMRETGESKTCVWRWQERFAAEGGASARQDAALAHPEARSFGRRAGRRADQGGASERSDALDRRSDGRGRRLQQGRASKCGGLTLQRGSDNACGRSGDRAATPGACR